MAKVRINPDQWVKISTAAKLLGINRQAMYYHVREGHLESLLIDDVQFVRRSELDSLKSRPQSRI